MKGALNIGLINNIFKKNTNDKIKIGDIYETGAIESPSSINNDVKNNQISKEKNIKANSLIKSELDEEQLKAVEAPLKNVCVFSIAGSGKTRVLTYRVANLIDNKFPEKEMMLLTFTTKASDEMTDRIKKILNKQTLSLTAGTFHSVANIFLREYASEIGYSPKFKIISPGIQKSLIDNCRNKYLKSYMKGISDEDFPSKEILLDIYSGSINNNKSFREYIKEYYSYFLGDIPDGIILILKDFVNKKISENIMDFDDLLLNFMDLLQIENIRKKINKDFKYIFVDEYQDINWIQYTILELLNGNNSIFVIGDAKQCIYQFRGSQFEYLNIFQSTHKDVQSYSLTYNYRSSPEILKLAEDVISRNDSSVIINSKNESSDYPFVFGCSTEEKECEQIAKYIISNKMDISETAILVRRSAQIAIVERAMKKYNISYELIGNTNIYELEHIQDVLAFVQLIDDKTNEIAFNRVIQLFSGIGIVTADTLYKKCKQNNFDYLFTSRLLNIKQQLALESIDKIISNKYDSIYDMMVAVIENFYNEYLSNKYSDKENRIENLNYLMYISKNYNSLTKFIDDITIRKNENKNTNNSLTIMTMHKSKGLEWENVFIPFLDKMEYPRCKDKEYLQNTENVRNERNLFYVAITRAKKILYLSYSLIFTDKPAGPSPFLEEIDEDLYDSEFFQKEDDLSI